MNLSLLLPVLVFCSLNFSCNRIKDGDALSHLQNSQFLDSNPVPHMLADFPLYERMYHYNVPGLSIAVVEEGEIIWARGFGFASVEDSILVNQNTLFQAASVSKPIAALGILRLVEMKDLDIDENVNKYLKNYKIAENEFTRTHKVTLRSILAHTSGLNVEGFLGYDHSHTLPTTTEVLNGMGNSEKVEVVRVPGEEWHYSGGGYTVLQQVIEDISNLPFEEFMRIEILEPLGMTNSTFEQPLPHKLQIHTSSAFNSEGKMFNGKWHSYPEKAAAGLWTTPTDLAKFAITIQKIYSGKSEDGIIGKEMIHTMFKDHFKATNFLSNTLNIPVDYYKYWGLGLEIAVKDSVVRFQHAGFNEGFKANITAFANKGSAIVIMANADNGFDLIMEIEKELSEFYQMEIWE